MQQEEAVAGGIQQLELEVAIVLEMAATQLELWVEMVQQTAEVVQAEVLCLV
jgi:hypothetical protein